METKCTSDLSSIPRIVRFPGFKSFELGDGDLIRAYTQRFLPDSCEYNFSNLFAWQTIYGLCFSMYQGRILIYDRVNQCFFMPLGKRLLPEEFVILALNLKSRGMVPCFGLIPPEYIRMFPDIQTYFLIREDRDYAEYIYDVTNLCDLTGDRLHKKKNLISQFKRTCPDYRVRILDGPLMGECLKLAGRLIQDADKSTEDLVQELEAIKTAFTAFKALKMEGLAVTVESKLVAFSVFSRLTPSTYDIQFEKADAAFKGSAQVINYETAQYLRSKCRYLNREQDLGVKGLRQAKMSYDPIRLIVPRSLVLRPADG